MKRKLRYNFNDPMVVILSALLVFITGGATLAGCTGHTAERPRIVAIDAAYGGENTGNTGLINEADYNESLVNAIIDYIRQDSRLNIYRTHAGGTAASVADKAEKLNSKNADVLISIHAGYSPDPNASGMTIYPDFPNSATSQDSMKLATAIQGAFTTESVTPAVNYLYYEPVTDNTYRVKKVAADDLNDYGLSTWAILEQTNMPAVVVEGIYVSSQADVDTWANEAGYQKAAEMYYKALMDYFGMEPMTFEAKEEE